MRSPSRYAEIVRRRRALRRTSTLLAARLAAMWAAFCVSVWAVSVWAVSVRARSALAPGAPGAAPGGAPGAAPGGAAGREISESATRAPYRRRATVIVVRPQLGMSPVRTGHAVARTGSTCPRDGQMLQILACHCRRFSSRPHLDGASEQVTPRPAAQLDFLSTACPALSTGTLPAAPTPPTSFSTGRPGAALTRYRPTHNVGTSKPLAGRRSQGEGGRKRGRGLHMAPRETRHRRIRGTNLNALPTLAATGPLPVTPGRRNEPPPTGAGPTPVDKPVGDAVDKFVDARVGRAYRTRERV